ncbi:hypothetical protein [Allokutzneria multivorans]|uniref:hypothetical protein n=1 Tax=Allokutzneria multivorans TaxID=1142134 RepID=UPI0031EEA5B3
MRVCPGRRPKSGLSEVVPGKTAGRPRTGVVRGLSDGAARGGLGPAIADTGF